MKKTITFSPAFATPPGMTVAVSALDVAHDRNLRIDVYPEDVRTDGATIYFKTWADTQIYGVTATWAAFGT